MFGNLPPPPAAYEGVKQAVDSGEYNGYGHSSGIYDARDTVAKQFSTQDCPVKAEVWQLQRIACDLHSSKC